MTLQKLRAESKETSALLPFFCRKEYRMWSLGPQVLTTLATGLASRKVDNPYVKDVYWPEILLALLQGETMRRREQTALSRAARRVYLVHEENGDWSKDFDALDTEAKAIHGRLVSSRHAFFGFRVMMGVDLASSYSLALCETAVRFAAEVEEQDAEDGRQGVPGRLLVTAFHLARGLVSL